MLINPTIVFAWLAIGMEVPPNISGTPKNQGPPVKNALAGTPVLGTPQIFALVVGGRAGGC